MDSKIKSSILFVCLNESFGKEICKDLAESLLMHFADCKELVEYDLFNSGELLSQFGEEYYLMREKKVIKMTCSYENSLMFSNYDIFNHNKDIFSQKATKVYLKLPKKLLPENDKINLIAYETHDEELKKNCDLIINIKKLTKKSALKEIIRVLGDL